MSPSDEACYTDLNHFEINQEARNTCPLVVLTGKCSDLLGSKLDT